MCDVVYALLYRLGCIYTCGDKWGHPKKIALNFFVGGGQTTHSLEGGVPPRLL